MRPQVRSVLASSEAWPPARTRRRPSARVRVGPDRRWSTRSRSVPVACRSRARTTRSPGRSPTTTSRSPKARRSRRAAPGLQLPGLRLPGARQEVREAARDEGRDRHLQLVRRGDREARLGAGDLRRRDGPVGLEHRQPDRAAAAGAAQPRAPAEPRQERLDRAAGPLLRPRQPLHGAVRRLGRRHRLAQRQGARGHRRHGRPLGHLLGVEGLPRQGRPPRRQARRSQHADAARRDARRAKTRTSTPRIPRSSPRRGAISSS